ncbi:MAG: PHP domain-containing protein [Thermomicrobiales bacterium]
MKKRHLFLGQYEPDMRLADMHVHTTRSDGTLTVDRALRAAQRRGLSGIVFADHDEIGTGYDARERCAQLGLPIEVIPCSEVSAKGAHILAFDVEDDIRPRLSIVKTVEEIVRRGGWVGMPHPGSKLTPSAPLAEILAMARAGLPVPIEVFNASVEDFRLVARWRGLPNSNVEARAFYEEHREILGPAIAGTDAHYRTLGRGAVAYHGDLRTALEQRETSVVYTTELERLTPWDLALHWHRLRRLRDRRAATVAAWKAADGVETVADRSISPGPVVLPMPEPVRQA